MFIHSTSATAVLTALFWDPFDAALATASLINHGFSEYDIDEIGVLCGRATDVTDLLFSMGIARDEAMLYSDCFGDGAMLLMVRTELGHRAKIALDTLTRHGGVPPARKYANAPYAALPGAEKEVASCFKTAEKPD